METVRNAKKNQRTSKNIEFEKLGIVNEIQSFN